MISVGQDK